MCSCKSKKPHRRCHNKCDTVCCECDCNCKCTCKKKCDKPPHCSSKCPYIINDYCNICKDRYKIYDFRVCSTTFHVVINCDRRAIEGFILAFVDCYNNPICFDDSTSYMSIETIECGDPTLISWNNKYYYTYEEQERNGMPANGALWTYHYPACETLRLSFRICPKYCYPEMRMFINLFYQQNDTYSTTLEPVIADAIRQDQSYKCTKTPCAPGYVSWMTSLEEKCDETGETDQSEENEPDECSTDPVV